METTQLEIKTKLQIAKPPHEVFEAIVDLARMSRYFISESSGRMKEGETLTWHFPEFDGGFPVRIDKIIPGVYISFNWDGEDGSDLIVEITLTKNGPEKTLVTITEKSMPLTNDGLKWLKSNTEGWANFLACLKAYLEFGINLRKGGFDYLKAKPEVASAN